jgi:ribonuclease M5
MIKNVQGCDNGMVRVKEAIVVEGRYDRMRLNSIVDAVIVETSGFGIFRNKEQMNLLRRLAESRGLIVLTDSDSAGFVIRDHLSSALPPNQVKHAYIPELAGKERRKAAPSKEGLLGVEGVEGETILEALRRAGATLDDQRAEKRPPLVDKARLFEDGLTGTPDSASRRERLLALLVLPTKLSVNRLMDVINATLSEEDYQELLRQILD